jgi:hypothetical protein
MTTHILKDPSTPEAFEDAYQYAIRNRVKTIAHDVEQDNVCPDCLVKMDEIDRYDIYETYPVSGPELVRNVWIGFKCPECGNMITVYNE